ncbi:MAG: hypothetical protein HOC20_00865 [Chloroflexi bacterium]|nr:hypothetical protein [Chloroflexota bacterium]
MKSLVVRHINLILTAVILLALAGLVVIGVFYMNEESKQDDLADEVAQKEAELDGMLANGTGEEAVLTAALARLEAANEGFPTNLDATDVITLILGYSAETHVDILPLNTKPATIIDIGGQPYMSVSFSATIHGTFENVLDFIDKLENGSINTFSVNGVNLSGSGSSWSTSMAVTVLSIMPSEDSDSSNSD